MPCFSVLHTHQFRDDTVMRAVVQWALRLWPVTVAQRRANGQHFALSYEKQYKHRHSPETRMTSTAISSGSNGRKTTKLPIELTDM
jgi:hypothetical protein